LGRLRRAARGRFVAGARMTLGDAMFVAAQLTIAAYCALALAAAARRWRNAPERFPAKRPVLLAMAALLLLGILLSAFDAWDNAWNRLGEPILLGAWLRLAFDLGVPLLALWALRVIEQRDAALLRLAQAAITDPLTGLANRRGFAEAAERAVAACRARGLPASVALFDIDRFKAVNDGHGHAAGDVVLVGLARVLREGLRAEDTAARIGGEEFALLCPGLGPAEVAAVCEGLRAALRAQVAHPAGGAAVVTASAGVAALPESAGPAAVEAALVAADRALYAAKAAGRDRVVIAGVAG
jgi:diguanylate cyclase (GGDEF)-like protein